MRDTATGAVEGANAPEPISAQQIRRALEEVGDAAEDLAAAQTETFADRVRVLLELCRENPAVGMVIAPLRELHIDVAPWFNPNRPMPGTFGYGGQGLSLPPKSRDQAAASLSILERIEENRSTLGRLDSSSSGFTATSMTDSESFTIGSSNRSFGLS
jgi:hypothetical protein